MKSPYFPFYVRDWICSRSVAMMSGDAVKAYMYLLAESWLSVPRGTLPNDDRQLAILSKLNIDDFLRIKDEIIPMFETGKCKEHKGLLFNETLLEVSRKSEAKQRFNNKNAKKTQKKSKVGAKVNAEPEYEYETEIEIKRKAFKKPLIEDVSEYIKEKSYPVDPERWYAHYEANGWMVGKNKMKDWKAAVRTWLPDKNSSPVKEDHTTWIPTGY